MPAKLKPPTRIGEVRIPGSFLYSLDDLWAFMHHRIVNDAAALAFARKSGPDAGVVTRADMIQSAELLMPAAIAELMRTLPLPESKHARRKTA